MKENMTRFHIAFTTMKCKTKHTISLSSLIKIFCHQEWIEIPFSLSKNICLKSEGKRSERRKFSGACLDKVLFVCLKFVLIRNMGCIGDFRFKLADVQIFYILFVMYVDIWYMTPYKILRLCIDCYREEESYTEIAIFPFWRGTVSETWKG